MKRLVIGALVFAALAFVGAALVTAQTPQVSVGQAFDLKGLHNGVNTTTYHLAIGGAGSYSADLPVSALSGGAITFTVPGLPTAGNYSAIITATGPGGSTPSSPFAFTVIVAAPAPVTGISLIPR